MRVRMLLVVVVALSVATCTAELPPATDRGDLSVRETTDAVIVETYEWTARHDKSAGGCVDSIELTQVDRPLLTGPMGARVNDWREADEPKPEIEITKPDTRTVVVTVLGYLCDENGSPSSIAFEHEYKYRREYLRHRLTLTPEDTVGDVSDIVAIDIPGIGYENFAASDAFGHGNAYHKHAGIADRGSIPSEGVAWQDHLPARVMQMFTGAYGGIDWFPAGEVSPWRWEGEDPVGSWRIEKSDGVTRMIAAVYQDSESTTFEDERTWEFYTTWPCATKMFQPAPAAAWISPEKHQPTPEDMEYLHSLGVELVMPACYWETRRWQEAGDNYRFYQHEPTPPLGDCVERAHQLGMRFVPYVDLPYGCVTRERYQKMGQKLKRTWTETPAKQNWWHHTNPQAGPAVEGCVWGHGCYGSPEFRQVTDDFLNDAWPQQDFDGIYYDHVALNHCTNPEHGGEHLIADGLFAMMDLTREMMGPGKYLYLHSASELSPCYAIQNYADWVIYYENYAYGLHGRMADNRIHGPEEYYEVFTAANNTGVDLTPALLSHHPFSPARVLTKYALWGDPKTVMWVPPPEDAQEGSMPGDITRAPETEREQRLFETWQIAQEHLRRFEPYDLGQFEFVPVVHDPATVTHGGYASAWKRKGELLMLVANLRDRPEDMRVIPQPVIAEVLSGGPLEITVGDSASEIVGAGRWMRVLREITVPAEDFVLVHIQRID